MTVFFNLFLIILGFGLLIFVHELGHFIAARWAGIRVEGFAIGFGPPLVSYRRGIGWRAGSTDAECVRRFRRTAMEMSDDELLRAGIGETEYTLRALPLGGFVRMLGQDDAHPAAVSNAPRSYQRCPIGRRMVVVSAGVIANLVLAVALFLVAFYVGVRFDAPVVGITLADSPASRARAVGAAEPDAALRAGDRIVAIDGRPAATYANIRIAGAMGTPNQPITLTVERAGLETPLLFSMVPERDPDTGLFDLGIRPALSGTLTDVPGSRGAVESRLRRLGLERLGPGSSLIAIGDRPASTWQELELAAAASHGAPLLTTWSRGGAPNERIELRPEPEFGLMQVQIDGRDFVAPGLFGLPALVRIRELAPDSLNLALLQPGDLILRADGTDAPNFAQIRALARARAGETIDLTVERDGQPLTVTVRVSREGTVGFEPGFAWDLPIIATPIEEVVAAAKPGAGDASGPRLEATPVAALRLFPRSTFVSLNDVPVADWAGLRAALLEATAAAATKGEGAELRLGVRLPIGDAVTETVALSLRPADVAGLHALRWTAPVPPTLFDPLYVTLVASGPLDAIRMGFVETKKVVLQTYLTIDRLFRGTVGLDKLNGPVGIVHIGVQVADQGFMYLVFFVAMLSVNLAVMNFLPLPIVDGGLFLFLVYEKLFGRPPSIAFQNAATAVGLVLIGSIFLFTFYNDVMRLVTPS